MAESGVLLRLAVSSPAKVSVELGFLSTDPSLRSQLAPMVESGELIRQAISTLAQESKETGNKSKEPSP